MMTKKLSIITASLALALSLFSFSAGAYAATAAQKAACEGAGLTATSGDCSGDTNTPTVERVIVAAVNILSAIVGLAAVIMIIVSGFRYMTGGGDPKAVASAKASLIHALIGLVIAALAQVLVQFVLYRTTQDTVTSKARAVTVSSLNTGSR